MQPAQRRRRDRTRRLSHWTPPRRLSWPHRSSNASLDDQSALQLYRETEGNPLFVVEMASAGLGREQGRHRAGTPDFSAPRLSTADLPPRMHAVIAGRLAQLSPEARELAGLAATVGRVFTVDILREASGADADTPDQELDELWQRRIVTTGVH